MLIQAVSFLLWTMTAGFIEGAPAWLVLTVIDQVHTQVVANINCCLLQPG